MELPKNKFKQKLNTGKIQYGLWLGIPDNSIAEIAAGSGFDWLLIDHEHGTFDLRSILAYLQAVAPYDVAPIVRPVSGDQNLIKKILDIGAQSLLIPMVDKAEQAKALVRAVRYPPQGIRGLGTSMARAARWNRVSGYAQKANDEICLIVQAETMTAMENLDTILDVEGVDGVFIGPSDLSASMGHPGNAGHPDVVTTISTGIEKIRAKGKHAGLLCLDPSLVETYQAHGASFIGVGVDTLILAQGFNQAIKPFAEGTDNEQQKPQAGY